MLLRAVDPILLRIRARNTLIVVDQRARHNPGVGAQEVARDRRAGEACSTVHQLRGPGPLQPAVARPVIATQVDVLPWPAAAQEWTVIGETTNLAAWLQALAAPGSAHQRCDPPAGRWPVQACRPWRAASERLRSADPGLAGQGACRAPLGSQSTSVAHKAHDAHWMLPGALNARFSVLSPAFWRSVAHTALYRSPRVHAATSGRRAGGARLEMRVEPRIDRRTLASKILALPSSVNAGIASM